MVDFATIGSSVVIGIICVLVFLMAVIFMGGNSINEGASNFILILAFFLVILAVAIPFLQINLTVVGMPDKEGPLKDSILASVWTTTIIFVAFLMITFLLLRMYPDQLMNFITLFTFLSFFVSLLAITLSTLQDSYVPS